VRAAAAGTMTMALKDLTGGDPQVVDLNDPQVRDECDNGFLWQKLKLWMKQVGPRGPRSPQSRAALMARRAQGSLCGCCYSLPRGQKREVAFDGGIIRGHAYGIIDVREHKDLRFLQAPHRPSTATPTPMRTRRARWCRGWVLRACTAAGQVRNPWGMKEWCGRWADYAPEWQNLDADAPQWMRSAPSPPGAGRAGARADRWRGRRAGTTSRPTMGCSGCSSRTGAGARRVQLVRKEGRDVSS